MQDSTASAFNLPACIQPWALPICSAHFILIYLLQTSEGSFPLVLFVQKRALNTSVAGSLNSPTDSQREALFQRGRLYS